MGSIRSQYVKKIAIDLVNTRPDIFSENFHKNKEIVIKVVEGEPTSKHATPELWLFLHV